MQTKTIIYFKHGLGNLIMMTPAIRALATMDESRKVDICMSSEWNDPRRPAYDDFFKRWDIIQEVINYPKMQFVKKYTRWFYTGHSEFSEAFNVFKEKSAIGAEAPDWRNWAIHEMYWYMEIVQTLGYKGTVPSQYVPLAPDPIIKKGKQPVIGICNGTYSYKMKTAKQWNYWSELATVLKNHYGATVIKVGYQDELKEVECDIDYVDKLSFTETAKVISQLDLFITTDSANMHVGDALNVNMVVLFGGTLISKNGCLSRNSDIVTSGLDCRPCQRTPKFYHCDNYHCMGKLTVGDVMAVVRRRLNDLS